MMVPGMAPQTRAWPNRFSAYEEYLANQSQPKYRRTHGSRCTKPSLDRYVNSRMKRNAHRDHSSSKGFGELEGANDSFYFQPRRGKLDLKRIARLDLDGIVENTDITSLQRHIENITFSDLTEDDMHKYSDRHFLKLFQITQLTVEYLLNTQVLTCVRYITH